MAVTDGQRVNAAVTNAAFLSRTQNTSAVGKITLDNSEIESGNIITNVQQLINELASVQGNAGEGDAAAKTYSSNNYVADGDDRKVAIGKLDAGLAAVNGNIDSHIADTTPHPTISGTSLESPTRLDVKKDLKTNLETYASTASNGQLVFATDVKLMFQVLDGTLVPVGGGIGLQEIPSGAVNGVNTDFDLTNLPSTTESLLVFIDGILLRKDQYSFSTPTITLTTAPQVGQEVYAFYLSAGESAAPIPNVGQNNVQYIEVTPTDITNGFITLASTPSVATHVMCDVIGSGAQQYSVDFIINTDQLDWNGRRLELSIKAGDVIRAQYFN